MRIGAGLSQRALADLCGLSGGYISTLETGRAKVPKRSVVERIARAFGDDGNVLKELGDHDRLGPKARQILERANRNLRKGMAFNRMMHRIEKVIKEYLKEEYPDGTETSA